MAKTEVQPDWYTETNPDVLLHMAWPYSLAYSGPLVSANLSLPTARRLRLFGVACTRMVWDFLPTDACNALLLSERFADGRATPTDLRAVAIRMVYGPVTFQEQALNAAGWASAGYWGGRGSTLRNPEQTIVWNPSDAARNAAKALAARAAGPAPPGGNPVSKEWQGAYNRAFSAAREYQAELVRDIFPPPGYTPALNPDWRTSTVVALARQMDETGDFSAVPILADALQDAGCDNDTILDRCRAPSNVHCRGNWIVDLVLGRE